MSGGPITEAEVAYLCAGVVMGCLSERAWPSRGETTIGPELTRTVFSELPGGRRG